MTYPIHPGRAWMILREAEEHGQNTTDRMNKREREACLDYLALHKLTQKTVDCLVTEIANHGDAKDREITRLQGAIMAASSALADWLTDNTEEAFEEQPEVDEARGILEDALNHQ